MKGMFTGEKVKAKKQWQAISGTQAPLGLDLQENRVARLWFAGALVEATEGKVYVNLIIIAKNKIKYHYSSSTEMSGLRRWWRKCVAA